MESEKVVTLKILDKADEFKVKFTEIQNLNQLFSLIYRLCPDLNDCLESLDLHIVYKGKTIQCSDDLNEVENNGILFVFHHRSVFHQLIRNPLSIKFRSMMDKAFFSSNSRKIPNFFCQTDGQINLSEVQNELRSHGIELDDDTVINILEQSNGDIDSLLYQLGKK